MESCMLYCSRCQKDRMHDLIDNKCVLHDMPKAARIIIAVCTLGISEFLNNSTGRGLFMCCHCGEIQGKQGLILWQK